MNRVFNALTRFALCSALACAAASAPSARAQQEPEAGPAGNGRGGVLPLPQGVRRVIAIDAQNVLLAELEPQGPNGKSEYRAIKVQHVYVGGIAKIFGGEVIPTEDFVSPGFSQRNGTAQGALNGPRFQPLNGQNGYNNGPNGYNPNGFGPNGYGPNGFNPNGFNSNNFNNYTLQGYGPGIDGSYNNPLRGPNFNGSNSMVPNTTPAQPTVSLGINGRTVFRR